MKKRGFILFFFLLTVKNDTMDQKSAKYAMKKINLHQKGLHCISYFYTNIRNSIAHHNTDSRLVSLSKCVIFKFQSIYEDRQLRPRCNRGESQVSSQNIVKPSCFLPSNETCRVSK